LLGLSGARQVEVANQVAQQQLSVRETERLVQQATAAPAARRSAPKLDADSRRLQEELAESLGAAVELKPRANGRGSVVIDYSSLDELQGLVKRLLRR
jgi:ParB family chromosome partitioning protein